MLLLVTRPEPDAERTASALRAQGHAVTIASLLRIEPLADAKIGAGPWSAIVVTSANAARAIAAHPRFTELLALPVLAVGQGTANAMREVGFDDVISGDGDVGDLARLAASRLRPGAPLLYLAGADRSGDLAGVLGVQNFMVRVVVIYRAVAADILPAVTARAIAAGIDGVLHFSRRSAEAFVRVARDSGLVEEALKQPVHFCLSARVAEPLMLAGAANIRIAREPAEAALLTLIPAP